MSVFVCKRFSKHEAHGTGRGRDEWLKLTGNVGRR